MALHGETPSNIIIKDLPKRENLESRREVPEYRDSEAIRDEAPDVKIKESDKTIQKSNEKFHDGVTMGQIYGALGVDEAASAEDKTRAISEFQNKHKLGSTGAIDSATLEALDKATGDDRSFRATASTPNTSPPHTHADTVSAGHTHAVPGADGGVTVGVSPADGGATDSVLATKGLDSSQTQIASTDSNPTEFNIREGILANSPHYNEKGGRRYNFTGKPTAESDNTSTPVANETPPTESSPETDKSKTTTISDIPSETSTTAESSPAETGTPKAALGDFDQAARLNMIEQVAGQLDTPEEIKEFGEATQGKSFAEVYALASTVPGINKDNLRSSIEGTEGYDTFRENIQSLSRDPNLDETTKKALQDLGITGGDVSTEDMLKMSQYGTAKGENQTPLSEKLHAEHTNGYIDPNEQNIVTSQPTEYRDLTGKNIDERMQAYGLSPAVQERIREQVQIRINADDVSPAGSTTPYLTKSFDGANMAELSNTSEANTGDLSNGLGREVTQTKFVDFVGGGRALTTEIDTTTGKTVVPGVGELVYPSGKQVRGEDYGIRITDPDNRYGAPVGSVVSLQDPRCPVYKPRPDGVMKEIGYINSPDPQTYAGNGKFVGKDPFEKIEVAELEIKKDKY